MKVYHVTTQEHGVLEVRAYSFEIVDHQTLYFYNEKGEVVQSFNSRSWVCVNIIEGE